MTGNDDSQPALNGQMPDAGAAEEILIGQYHSAIMVSKRGQTYQEKARHQLAGNLETESLCPAVLRSARLVHWVFFRAVVIPRVRW